MAFSPQKITAPLLIAREESARRLGVSLRTIDSLIANGDLPVVRIGRSIRIKPASLDQFIESRETRINPRKKLRP